MPKGVEHVAATARSRHSVSMRNSVMPKGVEHAPTESSNQMFPAYAEFSDAERR